MESRYNPAAVEGKIREFWEKNQTFKFDENSSSEVFSIDTPPPTVSGDIHMGHVFSYSQAEFIARYKRMRGFNVFYPFGLDNNGLPTEILIEKKFDTTAEKLGRDKFVELVRKEIGSYNAAYVELWKMLGLSVDWSLLYQTISPDVQKVSQKSFLELNKIGRVYRKEAPALFCPKDKTTVSQMELKDKMLKSKILYLKFSDDVTIATTRPELLPSCVAIFVSPEDEKHNGLVGKEVAVPIFGNRVKVIADRRVDPAFGTGVVMCCTFGDQTDIEWYKAYNLELKIIIDEKGRMNHPYYNGIKIKEAREKIIGDLKEKGYVIKEQEIEHSVNVHERCDTEIEFIVKKQWYIRYLDLKEKFLELGNSVKWYPGHMKVRYENWVRGLQWDWSISRQRYFGVYFPIWYCKNCGEPIFADEKDLPVDPFVDKPHENCSCGSSEFEPEMDIMDTWATSSLTPEINARWGIDGKYVKKILPMSLRAQAHDIITFWAFNTIVKSYFHMNQIPWKTIIINGHGLDPKGNSMHKSLGNVILPDAYLKKYGADALRYWASSSLLGEDNSFQEKDVITGSRLINKLWNLSRFVEMNCKEFDSSKSASVIDAWIMGRLDRTIEEATIRFDEYDYFNARFKVEELFWGFANDYLEFVKDRVYNKDLKAAYTIKFVLFKVLKMLSPFMPFVAEEIYQQVFATDQKFLESVGEKHRSIHSGGWPNRIDVNAADGKRGELAVDAIIGIRKKKHDTGIALNEALSKAVIYKKYQEGLVGSLDEVKESMRVREIVFDGEGEESEIVKGIEK
ncbi:MAG: valine--tRNA ligase [Candidatus Micrarchaeota archaeon]|nr:valine--tRNA ligase [Candidatus Micrarchaeota archaeon]MDE1848231.1 valine--tRNA ligase [Candidatus Micrarchaeota archaeon]MDE1864882.1 valine--tRNA ligase [Candidatus Micrarchaeota archaeon]